MTDEESEAPGDAQIELPSQEPFSQIEAATLMGAQITRLVVLGGPQASGKTTLIASLYERLQLGPFDDYMLSWCSSFLGFERICHEGRDASGRSTPETLHTSRQAGFQLYHLRLFRKSQNSHQDLLITDLSGEEFEDVREFDDSCAQLGLIRRADHFALLVSGEKIADPSSRHQACDESLTLLHTLLRNKLLSTSCHVQIVISMNDKILEAGSELRCEDFVLRLEQKVRDEFSKSFASLAFHRIIARDPHGQVPLAEGVSNLIEKWVSQRRVIGADACFTRIPTPPNRPFDQFRSLK